MCKPKSHGGMGFKDLSCFNDALLAKHTSRLLHDHQSLFYRVFKAKIFPDCSVIEAKPSNALYAWKSILQGCDVIKRGAAWRIGSGNLVHIWGDKWLTRKFNNKIISPPIARESTAMSACKSALPTKTNLVKRQVVTSDLCEMCKPYSEDIAHALYHCPKLENFWQNIPLWSHSTIRQSTSFSDIMFVICAENRDPELFSSVAWTLWNRRNNLRLGKPSIHLEQLLDRARERLPGPISASAVLKQATATWTPPPLHGYKINCNGAIFEQENSAALGVVIRNHDGMVMASLSELISLPSAVIIDVETLAAQWAVEFALELGFNNIFLEGDSEVLIKLLNSNSRRLFTSNEHALVALAFGTPLLYLARRPIPHVLRCDENPMINIAVPRFLVSPSPKGTQKIELPTQRVTGEEATSSHLTLEEETFRVSEVTDSEEDFEVLDQSPLPSLHTHPYPTYPLLKERKSIEAALAGAKKQVEDQRLQLRKAEEQLAVAKEQIEAQKKEMEKVEEVATRTEQYGYDIGVKETETS
ncbi:hypothetical protein SO802_023516 [Lithocarpus litseifolius]|uniref:RNase H type-1 domain-containing protein n=1 Tax=Lithocarpus litseifolius TaxID=425828 RepID=A0AAW2C8L3_9ROSI